MHGRQSEAHSCKAQVFQILFLFLDASGALYVFKEQAVKKKTNDVYNGHIQS